MHVSASFKELIQDVQKGLSLNLNPQLTMDGTGGTYMHRNKDHKTVAVFKPLDEEAFAPYNPRGYTGKLGSPGFREGVLSGESCYREVIAFLLDT
jgi:hypothetical protein